MERVARHMQVVAGLAAVGALAGCLALAGCGSAPEASSPQPTQAQPAASQQPTAAKQDSKQDAKPSDTAKASDDSALGSGSSSSDSVGRSDLQLGEFQAKTLQGGSFTQEDIAAKDVTVLNMWSTTCGPCVNEMPEVAAFAAALPQRPGGHLLLRRPRQRGPCRSRPPERRLPGHHAHNCRRRP